MVWTSYPQFTHWMSVSCCLFACLFVSLSFSVLINRRLIFYPSEYWSCTCYCCTTHLLISSVFSLLVISIASGQNDTSEWDAQLSSLLKIEKDGQNCVKKLEHLGKEGVVYIFMVNPFIPSTVHNANSSNHSRRKWLSNVVRKRERQKRRQRFCVCKISHIWRIS